MTSTGSDVSVYGTLTPGLAMSFSMDGSVSVPAQLTNGSIGKVFNLVLIIYPSYFSVADPSLAWCRNIHCHRSWQGTTAYTPAVPDYWPVCL